MDPRHLRRQLPRWARLAQLGRWLRPPQWALWDLWARDKEQGDKAAGREAGREAGSRGPADSSLLRRSDGPPRRPCGLRPNLKHDIDS